MGASAAGPGGGGPGLQLVTGGLLESGLQQGGRVQLNAVSDEPLRCLTFNGTIIETGTNSYRLAST